MDLEQLRWETLPDYNAVEQSVPLMDEALDVDTYVSCLHWSRQSRALNNALRQPQWSAPYALPSPLCLLIASFLPPTEHIF